MRLQSVLVAVLALAIVPSAAFSVQPAYREIRMSIDAGGMTPTGAWSDVVKPAFGLGADLGIALTPQLLSGFVFSYNNAKKSDSYDLAPWGDTSQYDWALYNYEAFIEYLPSKQDLSPFVRGRVGVHFIHIDISGNERVASIGDHGIGYTLDCGVRYRANDRLGYSAYLGACQSPGLFSGWRLSACAGISLFL